MAIPKSTDYDDITINLHNGRKKKHNNQPAIRTSLVPEEDGYFRVYTLFFQLNLLLLADASDEWQLHSNQPAKH
jgi:hypothetical protein